MKPLSEYTRSALELSEKTTEKLRRSTHAALALSLIHISEPTRPY